MRKLLLLLCFLIPVLAVGQVTFPNSSKQQGKKLFMDHVKFAKSAQLGANGMRIDSLKLVNGEFVVYYGATKVDPAIADTLTLGSALLINLATDSVASKAVVRAAANLRVGKADTTAMLTPYAKKHNQTFTGTIGLPSTTSIGNASSTELGYVDGVTSGIQTQLTSKINKLDSSIVAKNGGYPSSKMFADNLALQIHKADSSGVAAGSYTTGKDFAVGQALKVDKATMPTIIGIACSDETTALTASTSVAKVTFRMPYAMTVTAVRASVTTAPTGATILVDIHESGTTILSTKIMIDATELTSTTAATGYVIADAALADDASITVFADQVGSTVAGAGLKIWIIGTRVAP